MSATHHRRGRTMRPNVINWRSRQLRTAGLEPQIADLLATDQRWDLHAILQLIERGCPPSLAMRIESPLDDLEMTT